MANFFTRLSQVFQNNKNSPPAPANSKTTLGAVIKERYRLDEEIGRGGMGIVYRAHDIPNERDVALKIINLEAENALTLGQFSREAEIAAQFDHPHIVTVHEVGAVDIGASALMPFIVMELLQGLSLDQMRGLTYARIVDIGTQICDALEYIHRQGYVYRDLKPANTILQKRGFHYFVKLIDFGLARLRGEAYLPNESSLAGTVFYLAPELINGQPADVGSDLYALGVLLYELITGRVPFFNVDENNIRMQHLEEQPAPPSHSRDDVPPALEAIILRLLEKDPKDRFASAREVQDALAQVVLRNAFSVPGNLPLRLTEILGCKNEITQIISLLESTRLVTVLDNKSDLVLAVGAQLADQFLDGIWFVELESVREPMMVLQTVTSVFGVCENQTRPLSVALFEYLREKNLLLVLSHCGHLVGACSQFAETILSECPEIWILTISDHPLDLSVEKSIAC